MDQLPNLGVFGNIEPCDDNIVSGLNYNSVLIDALLQFSVIDFVASLPLIPAEGDRYILTTDGSVNYYKDGAWVVINHEPGFFVYNQADGLFYFFNGTTWEVQNPNDHSLLLNLAADDHTQYLTEARGDARYYTEAESDILLSNNSTFDTNRANHTGTQPLSTISQSGAIASDVPIWNGSTWVPGPVVASGNKNIVFYSTTATASINDDIIHVTGASDYALTLPTAVGNTGKEFIITYQNFTLGVQISIVPQVSQLIAGLGSFELYTYQESIKIISNGANWLLLDHYAETPWIDAGTNIIRATTTNPTKASSIVEDVRYWKRSGDSIRYLMRYKQGAATGATAGSGTYIFEMPTNLEINTSITGTSNPTGTGANSGFVNQAIGSVVAGYSGFMRPGSLVVRSSGTEFSLYAYRHPNVTLEGLRSGFFGLNSGSDYFIGVDVTLPILGWQP